MIRPTLSAAALACALCGLSVALAPPASAQLNIQIGTAPPPPPAVPRGGAYGDRDRDGVPNAYDRYNNNRVARDRDHDGVPNRWDSAPRNPYYP
jgi:hypothetical protein